MDSRDVETTVGALVILAGIIMVAILAASAITGDWGWLVDENVSGQDGYCVAHPNNPICE